MRLQNALLKLILASALVFAAAPVFAQTVNPAKVKINGVGLDSSYAQVVKALGKPASETKPVEEACIGAHEKYVKYAGLHLYFMDGDSRSGKTFEVKNFQVKSPKWVVSGVKVGDTEAVVRSKFGRRFTVGTDPESRQKMWTYEMNDQDGPGWTTVTFKNGRVTSISSAFQVC
jgi:hypothetical protein